ncbi:S41 family peptidase [Clostridium botulinum]|uniref:S41 family peptidase n=1 Tax=Clostridium botulinum TaxID=1491 RepID=UPI0019684C19|nr:S41 family peptidase [Clostridium botulinum]MBN1064723.1 peptidase S41 [Clostridium botulinum]
MKFNKKGKVIATIVLVIAVVIGIFAFKIFHRVTNSPMIKSEDRNEKFIADIEFLKKELPKKHKNLFFSKSKEEFNDEIDSLINNVSRYSDEEINGELAKIIVSINDSHTNVDIMGSLAYPLSFFQFGDDIYLVDGDSEYKEYWGKKLVSINGYSINELKEKLEPFISKDNEAISKNQFSVLLKCVEVLKLSGIVKEDNATFTFEGSSNADVMIKPVTMEEYMNITTLSSDEEFKNRFPISKQNSNDNYWFKYIEEENTMYVKYNSCMEMKEYSFSNFTKDVFNVIDTKNATKLVVDLRDNGGGNSRVFETFLDEIKKRENINKEGNLYAIIGRRTFSSAVLNAMSLRNETNATLIGEPTGGKPNHFGEVKTIHLSNVNIDVNYSSNYFKTSDEDTDSIYPDVEINLKAESFFNGQDDFFDYVIR